MCKSVFLWFYKRVTQSCLLYPFLNIVDICSINKIHYIFFFIIAIIEIIITTGITIIIIILIHLPISFCSSRICGNGFNRDGGDW